MKRTVKSLALGALLGAASPVLANVASSQPPPDAATAEDIHRKRLRSEYLLLQDSRTTTWGSDFGVEGRLGAADLAHYRQELSAPAVGAQGLSSYPHPYLMPEFWQFPTG